MQVITIHDYWPLVLKSKTTPYIGLIVRVPPRFWREISKVQSELMAVDSRQIYSHPSTLHITVKGLGLLGEGEILSDETKLEAVLSKIRKIISEFKPFEINLRGLGVFPTSIYVGVEDRLNQLQMMNKMICQELQGQIDKSAYDEDAFIPHVTIASFNTKDVDGLLSKVNSMKAIEFGQTMVFETEAVEVRMFMALRPGETQQKAFSYIRGFHLG